ncbi:MAG: preprotein translocase subunit SecE [Erysipelotrichaceae bacterium]|nr:preprotein translocase subunit SecE [Erysipelotrichaceae bacterium]MBR5049379.1 preprotein translocase subunit SecE [Erysipelotrichaceae bacterium]
MAKENNKQTKSSTSLWEKITGFFTGVQTEAKRVRWPKFSELMSNSGKVIVFCVLFAIFFVICDLLISEFLVLIGVGK